MRAYLLIMFLFVCPAAFAQQENPLPAVQQKMQALQWLTGKWEGPVYINGGDGKKREYKQTLQFSPKLKNSVLVLDEAAFLGQDTIFQNIGVLSYDVLQARYTLKAYTKEGAHVDPYVEVQDKKMVWRIHIPGNIVRYTIKLNEKGQWHQIGEISGDEGKRWKPFFESTLSRLN
jgi:hypothetical protein